jgi:hypothetical protein
LSSENSQRIGTLSPKSDGWFLPAGGLVCFHGAVECGKLLISSERLRKYPISLCVSVAPRPLAGGNRIGHHDRHVTIGPSTNFLSMLVPYRPELGGFALTLTETLQTGERLAPTLLSFTGMGANRQD